MSALPPKRVERVRCHACDAEYLANEASCWKCGARPPGAAPSDPSGTVDFASSLPTQTPAAIRPQGQPRLATTLTGEVVELTDFSAPAGVAPGEVPAHRVRNEAPGPSRTEEPPDGVRGLADFSAPVAQYAPTPDDPPPTTRFATTLTGEVVELPDLSVPQPPHPSGQPEKEEAKAAQGAPSVPVMRLTYCKDCGLQNDESAIECRKCRRPLEIISEPVGELNALRRSWGFDVLGLAWLVLGIAAVYCGQFIVKADPQHPGVTWADYFWTGIVVCAPGVLIFLRHYFCKFLFWVLMFASLLVWSVIGFIWLYIGLHVTDNGMVGLMWLGALSGLSLISYITVRLNDEFDYGT